MAVDDNDKATRIHRVQSPMTRRIVSFPKMCHRRHLPALLSAPTLVYIGIIISFADGRRNLDPPAMISEKLPENVVFTVRHGILY